MLYALDIHIIHNIAYSVFTIIYILYYLVFNSYNSVINGVYHSKKIIYFITNKHENNTWI